MLRWGKRKITVKTFPDCESPPPATRGTVEVVNLDLSPPPPKLYLEEELSDGSDKENGHLLAYPHTSSPIHQDVSQRLPVSGTSCDSALLLEMNATLRNVNREVMKLRERMTAVELSLNALHALQAPSSSNACPFPLPMDTIAQLSFLNNALENAEFMNSMVHYLSNVSGRTISESVRNVMLTCMTNNLVRHVNWRGVHEKYKIANTPFARAVLDSIMRKNIPGCTEPDIVDKLRRWIQRIKERESWIRKETERLSLQDSAL
ncbi:unnamed protein product [Dicrocoelium dendriticum]|nr:unnamed protein product [Dicrocoelium dendriticum]